MSSVQYSVNRFVWTFARYVRFSERDSSQVYENLGTLLSVGHMMLLYI